MAISCLPAPTAGRPRPGICSNRVTPCIGPSSSTCSEFRRVRSRRSPPSAFACFLRSACPRRCDSLSRASGPAALVYQPALGVEARRGVPGEDLGKVSNRSRSSARRHASVVFGARDQHRVRLADVPLDPYRAMTDYGRPVRFGYFLIPEADPSRPLRSTTPGRCSRPSPCTPLGWRTGRVGSRCGRLLGCDRCDGWAQANGRRVGARVGGGNPGHPPHVVRPALSGL